MTLPPLHQALCGRALEGATGALDWTDAKRRRVFFFVGGQLSLVQSNLRSESPEKLAELDPTLVGPVLATAVGRARVIGALKEAGGELRWLSDATAPKAEPVDLAAAVYESGTRRPGISSWPKLAGAAGAWLSRQDMPRELQAYLSDLDGTRTLDELVSFAPGGPEAAERWIRIAFTIGAIIDAGIESSPYEVRSVKKRGEWATGGGGSVDDIASLISEGLGQERPPPHAHRPNDGCRGDSVRPGPGEDPKRAGLLCDPGRAVGRPHRVDAPGVLHPRPRPASGYLHARKPRDPRDRGRTVRQDSRGMGNARRRRPA